MKVLVVSNMWPGPRKPNFGVFVADRVRAYRSLGSDVAVVANDDPRKAALLKLLKYGSLVCRGVWAGIRFRPGIVEGHYLMPVAPIARLVARVARCPYVLYAHGSDLEPRFAPLLRRSVLAAAEVHTNSEASAEKVRSLFGDVTVVISPPGVDRDLFVPGTPEQGHVVFVGDLVAHKGVDVLLGAMAAVDDAFLTVVGDGPEKERLVEEARSRGISDRVTWVGRVDHDNVAHYLADAWVVAVPSRSDALGQAAVEALAAGVPVVVTNVGGLASVPDSESGSVVEVNSSEDLAAALEHWLSISPDERAAASEAARLRSSAHDLVVVATRSLERFQAVAERAVRQ